MTRLVLGRLMDGLLVILVATLLVFTLILNIPGGPFDDEKQTDPAIIAELETQYGLDQPVWKQYLNYISSAIRGDLGPSYKYTGWSVNEIIAEKFPLSLELAFWALLVAVFLGITFGVLAAIRPNKMTDYSVMSLAMIGICMPTFVIGPLFVLVFALQFEWVNAMGWNTAADRILPSLTLGIYLAGYIARLTRGSMLETLNQDYIRTARAKGAPEWRVVLIHGLRNGLLPVVAFLGPAAAGLLGGTFVVETIFNLPGLGRYFVTAAFNRDYTLVMGAVLFYAVLIVSFNLLADLIQAWLNPRLRGSQ